MRFAKTVTALALACSLALAIPTFAAPAAEEQAGRQEDLELLYQTIRDRHPGPFTNTPEQEFLARIAQIEARIDTEDSMSFGLDLQSLVALIGDSHTTTNLNSILSSGHMFPVSVKWMDGDWVLYQVDASHQGALGQQVTSVNGFSMDQVQEKMAPLISADNEIKLRRQLSQVFGHQEIMVYCGLLKPEEDLTLTLENGTSITLSPLSMQDQSGWPEINGLSQQRQGSAPTDYQKGTYYFSLPLDSRTYYIQYNQCMEDPELPMETFTAQVMADLEQGSYSVLLLDLRNNGGGSDGVIIPLLMELAPLVRSGELELWGLVGEATFSSASINALEIREMGGGLAGEPTSGSVDHFGSVSGFTLPNSGIRVGVSSKYIDLGTLLDADAGRGVVSLEPDVELPQTMADTLAGKDTAVEWLLAHPERLAQREWPNAPLTRGRFVGLLYEAAGSPVQTPEAVFPDMLGVEWYLDAMIWSANAGVSRGTADGSFAASRAISWQEAAVFLTRTVQALGWTPETVRTAPLPAVLSKGAWDQEALQSAWAWGLLPENADSTPTRAQGEAMAAALQELG